MLKKVLLSSVLSLNLISSLNAYELNGDLNVKWAGFKGPTKIGVPGTFKDIKLSIEKNDDLSKFLQSANVTIRTNSLDSKLPMRDDNITSTIFSLATAKEIKANIISIDEAKSELVLKVTMNQIEKAILMKYEKTNSDIVAKGTLEILNFGLSDSFAAFEKKCGPLHQMKSYSEVDIEFTLPYK